MIKVLVYGSGVIGCYLAHVLCAAGNDVTLLARGQWKEQLQQNGLRIRHHLQRKTTLDHPRVIGGIEDLFCAEGSSVFLGSDECIIEHFGRVGKRVEYSLFQSRSVNIHFFSLSFSEHSLFSVDKVIIH